MHANYRIKGENKQRPPSFGSPQQTYEDAYDVVGPIIPIDPNKPNQKVR